MLKKSKTLTGLSLSELNGVKVRNSKKLIKEISNVLDTDLASSCTVESVLHYQGVKAQILNIKSKVALNEQIKPGTSLVYKNEPTELYKFTYNQLKYSAQQKGHIYSGILNGTVKVHDCAKTVACPDCSGTGICHDCEGKKKVTCPVCDGDLECVACNGTGIYTCRNCDGDGVCPDCDEGWVTCDDCDGDGTIDCPDCNGTGNYIDDVCNRCGGSGWYAYDKECNACNGTGRYVVKCRRCRGKGEIKCSNCDGDGGWDCNSCHGSGVCSHCHGSGGFTCKACDGTGTCGKCRGKGEIKCPTCHGKGTCYNCKGKKEVSCPKCEGTGFFQSYTQYSLTESKSVKEFCALSIASEKEFCPLNIAEKDIAEIEGDVCYNNVLYCMFAKQAEVYDLQTLKECLGGNEEIINKWFTLEKQGKPENEDYLNTTVKVYRIPVTAVKLKCREKAYHVYIVGNNRIVYYDDLPWIGARILGRFTKLFE